MQALLCRKFPRLKRFYENSLAEIQDGSKSKPPSFCHNFIGSWPVFTIFHRFTQQQQQQQQKIFDIVSILKSPPQLYVVKYYFSYKLLNNNIRSYRMKLL